MNYSANIDNSELSKFDALAKAWWEPNGPCAPLHILNPVRLAYIQRFDKLENKKILDVGCGGGILTESMSKLHANVTGIDASSEVIAAAKEHASNNNLAIEYQHTYLEEFISKNQAQFEIITCMELIEHVPDPAKLIMDCSKLLQPGGKLFISTLNRTLKAYALAIIGAEYLLNILPKHTHDYKKFIKPSELDKMLKHAGLKLENLCGLKYDPFTKTAKLYDSLQVNYLACASKRS